jgi:hypothetical protein
MRPPTGDPDAMRRDLNDLLLEVITLRRPDLLFVLGRDPASLDNSLKNVVRETIGDELAERGFDETSEPTPRGLLLEELIDVFAPY